MPISHLSSRRLDPRAVWESIDYQQRPYGSLCNTQWRPLFKQLNQPHPQPYPKPPQGATIPDEQRKLDAQLWENVANGNLQGAKRDIAFGGNVAALDAGELWTSAVPASEMVPTTHR